MTTSSAKKSVTAGPKPSGEEVIRRAKRAGRVLYLSYDGILEPLGFSQVFRYLEGLAGRHFIVLVSYEKNGDLLDHDRVAAMRDRCKSAGIAWYPLRYHKRPTSLATSYDLFIGLVLGIRLSMQYGIRIVHARSYVMSVIAIALKALCRSKFIFDMRGFWADERVEGGLWPAQSFLYRTAKWFERQFLLRADAIVSLTNAAVREMGTWPFLESASRRFFVIPTCADVSRFLPGATRRDSDLVLGYVGSVGLWYDFDAALQFFAALRRVVPGAKLCILNRDAHDYIHARLIAQQIPLESVSVMAVRQEEVPKYMATMTAGVFFIKPTFSKQASAPTKFAEFLACGLPSVVRAGIGDMDRILEEHRVGISVTDTDPLQLERAVSGLLELLLDPEVPQRGRRVATEIFSLQSGVESYASIYDMLSDQVTAGLSNP